MSGTKSRFRSLAFRAARVAHRWRIADSRVYKALSARVKRRFYQRSSDGALCGTVNVNGATLKFPYNLSNDYILKDFEPETVEAMKRFVGAGDTVVDIGANVGFFTLLFSTRVGRDGKVVAVEPSSENSKWLRTNVEENGFSDQVTVKRALVGASNGTARLYLAAVGVVHSTVVGGPVDGQRFEELDQVRADGLHSGVPKLVKIDVEGAEQSVLDGFGEWAGKAPVMIEFNPEALERAGTPPRALLDWFDTHGYEISLLDSANISSVDALRRRAETGDFPPSYYCNLFAVPRQANRR